MKRSHRPRTSTKDKPPSPGAPRLHARNAHQGRYDFAQLSACHPPLAAWLTRAPDGHPTIDFSQPLAVRSLNRALLHLHYGIKQWDFPEGYLCPPIPGRADYVHALADLLAEANAQCIPWGPVVRVLDIGVGASCIYPLIGQRAYGWRFVGVDIDPVALSSAREIIAANPILGDSIELRQQRDSNSILAGVLRPDEYFDLSMCNPPFHASAADAARGTARKWRNLGTFAGPAAARSRNFGGQHGELCCSGGEVGFVQRMISESRAVGSQVLWFTSLVSSASSLRPIRKQLAAAGVVETRQSAMAQGSKRSRFVAWTFLDANARVNWRERRRADSVAAEDASAAQADGASVPQR